MRYDEPRLVWTSLPITHYDTREEPGTLTQGGALFSLVPLIWNRTQNSRVAGAKPNHQPIGGSDPNHQGIWSVESVCLLLQGLL